MGYTLVARINDDRFEPIKDILEKEKANKIPYGRNCDREAANVNLPYHITLSTGQKSKMNSIYR